jgi:hypothetical protein
VDYTIVVEPIAAVDMGLEPSFSRPKRKGSLRLRFRGRRFDFARLGSAGDDNDRDKPGPA